MLSARRWLRAGRLQALALLAIALLTAALFAGGALDIEMARWFYRPGAADHWPLSRQLPWSLLYRSATWITAVLVIVGLAALAASFAPTRGTWRRAAVLVLLSVAIGPGLLGNALFKDHWHQCAAASGVGDERTTTKRKIVWPLATGLQGQVANHRKRLASKASVVSVAEKVPVGIR